MRVRDEVCGMMIRKRDAAVKVEFQDEIYFFCSERCRLKFEEHPGRYLGVGDESEESPYPDPPLDHPS